MEGLINIMEEQREIIFYFSITSFNEIKIKLSTELRVRQYC